jgi:hypothetical protein
MSNLGNNILKPGSNIITRTQNFLKHLQQLTKGGRKKSFRKTNRKRKSRRRTNRRRTNRRR